jgi:formamidopyrimidine-DNA glycosylase
MPELPDVKVFKQYLDATSLHQTIETVKLKDNDLLKGISGTTLRQQLQNNCFTSSRRHENSYVHREKSVGCSR